MLWMARKLRRSGLATLTPTYRGRRHDIDTIVGTLDGAIGAFAEGVPGRVHFVTHSLGGLVVRALLMRPRTFNLGRVVMLAPPNHGSEWADLLIRLRLAPAILGRVAPLLATERTPARLAIADVIDYPLGIIAGTRALDPIFPRIIVADVNDGKVTVHSTRIEGMTDHMQLPVTHTFMTLDSVVISQTIHFLHKGQFAR